MPDPSQSGSPEENRPEPQAPKAAEEEGVERHAILSEIMALMDNVTQAPPAATPRAQEPAEQTQSPAADETPLADALKKAEQVVAEQTIEFGTWEKPSPASRAEAAVHMPGPAVVTPAPVATAARLAPGQAAPVPVAKPPVPVQVPPAPPARTPAPAAVPPPATASQMAMQAASELAKGTRPTGAVGLRLVVKTVWEVFYALLHVALLPVRIPARLLILFVGQRRTVLRFLRQNARQLIAVLGMLVGLAWLFIGLSSFSVLPILLAVAFLFPAVFFAVGLLK